MSEELLKKLLPEGVFSTIGKVFDLVEIAEEEIKAATLRYPWKEHDFKAAFQECLFPGDLARFGKRVYRAHAKEMLQRVADDADTKPGTLAECAVALSLASLKAPLTSGHTAAMEKAFAFIFPEMDVNENRGREAYAGETDEILSELRRKIGAKR